jgi:AraC-like DNA-binding protein
MGTLAPSAALAAMQYNELLARRIVAEVARSSVDGGALQPVMLHEIARRLKIDEASAEAAMYRAIAERWLNVEGTSLCRIRLTAAGQALLPPG